MERDNALTDVIFVVGQTGGQRTELLSDHPADGSQQGKHAQRHQHHGEGAWQADAVQGIDDRVQKKGKQCRQRQRPHYRFAKVEDYHQQHASDQSGERNRAVFFDGGDMADKW